MPPIRQRLTERQMIAIDWSHTKGLTTYDGEKLKVETLKSLISRLNKDGGEDESSVNLQSTSNVHSSLAILEQGCPLSLIYTLVSHGIEVRLIDNQTTEIYRKSHGVEKTDENDAKIIYELSNNGNKTSLASPDFKTLQLADLYHQYCRIQKARVSNENMKRAHKRQYALSGDSESMTRIKSSLNSQLSPDLLAYDIAIDTFKARERELLKKLAEATEGLPYDQAPQIKGLGQRIWLGLMVTCNPATFKCLSAYLRYCGLTSDVIKSHRYNRHAKMLYHMLAEEVMKLRDHTFRPIYDKCKTDVALAHHGYTKLHIHNAALNRTATVLAKRVFNHIKGNGQCKVI